MNEEFNIEDLINKDKEKNQNNFNLGFLDKIFITILGLILLSFISGCSTLKNDKIETIVKEEIKIEYVLPKLNSCNIVYEKIKDGTLEEFYLQGKELKSLLKECNDLNEEKKKWIERNFKK